MKRLEKRLDLGLSVLVSRRSRSRLGLEAQAQGLVYIPAGTSGRR